MAQFRAQIRGQRGEASRLGGKSSGISASVNGWHLGVAVNGSYNEKTDSDEFRVDLTAGSNGGQPDYIIEEHRNANGVLTGFTVSERPAEIADGA